MSLRPFVRRSGAILGAVLLLAVAGCGGENDGDEPESPSETLLGFVEAAGAGDAEAMWADLSAGTRERWGPTFDEFRAGVALELAEGLGSFAPADYEVALGEQVSDGLGVAAIEGARTVEGMEEYAAYAAALVTEDGVWKLALDGPSIVPLEPGQGASVSAPDRARARAEGAEGLDDARMWLDGAELEPVERRGDSIEAPLDGLEQGPHSLVVYVADGGEPAATAWTFTVE
jgi:hypothetical protein